MDKTKNHETMKQLAGFAKDKNGGNYDCLYITDIGAPIPSEVLVKSRVADIARVRNQSGIGDADYDLEDIIVQEREVTITYGEWKNTNKN